jgi:hypothetical protein
VKAVVYHADASFAWGGSVGDLYKQLFERFRKQCNDFGMELIHLTLEGEPGWGDRNIHYSGLDQKNVVLNREECFTRFLETAEDEVYWFAEPDIEIIQMWPPLTADCAMLYRAGDAVAMNPAWRMATPKALPFFTKLREELRAVEIRPGVGHDWHGDSAAFTKVWKDMGKPTERANYLGVEIEFRNYSHYIKGEPKFTRNHFGKKKLDLVR